MSKLAPRRSRAKRSQGIGLLITLFLLLVSMQQPIAQELSSSKYTEAVKKARLLHQQGKTKAAIASYRKANEIAEGKSAHCLLALAILYNNTGSFEKAADHAQRVIGLTEDPGSLQRAYKVLGAAIHSDLLKSRSRRTDKDTSAKLGEAEVALRKVIEFEGHDGSAYFLLANVLADQMVRWERWSLHGEIKVLSRKYLKLYPNGPNSDWARKASCWIEEPQAEVANSGRSSSVETVGHGNATSSEEGALASASAEAKPQENPKASRVPLPETALQVGGDVIRPKRIFAPQPQYGEWARKSRIQGEVVVEAIIDKQGRITNVRVLKGLPLCLSEQAILAIRQWKFEPATLNGKPIDVYYNMTVNFRLE